MLIIYSNGMDGFFSAVFDIYYRKLSPTGIYNKDSDVQLSLTDSVLYTASDAEKSKRVQNGIAKISPYLLNQIKHAYLHGGYDKDMVIYRYIRLLFEKKNAVKNMLNDARVIAFNDTYRQVRQEIHKFKGFLRFRELSNGVMYAPINPVHDIVERLFYSIKDRFVNMAFCLHDTVRQKLLVYDTLEYRVITGVSSPEIMLSEEEQAVQSVWGQYYRSVNIDERADNNRYRRVLPLKYRKFLTELHPDCPPHNNNLV